MHVNHCRPAVPKWYTYGDTCRPTSEQALEEGLFIVFHGKDRSKNVLEKTLEQRRPGSL